jgi:hypothetical protein
VIAGVCDQQRQENFFTFGKVCDNEEQIARSDSGPTAVDAGSGLRCFCSSEGARRLTMPSVMMARLRTQPPRPQAHSFVPAHRPLLQRKCACGGIPGPTGECESCHQKRLQRKLTIGASNDPLEQEADRIADEVLAAPAHPAVSGAPPRIQRFTGQATEQAGTAPASVDRVLASSGRPLEPTLRRDMEQHFGHDFSGVRVHTDSEAAESARKVYALAYTTGPHIVFGVGQFAPATYRGRELLAHELAHTIQQRSANAPPPSPALGGIFERSAEAAGHDVANDRPASTLLLACGIGLARAAIPLTDYSEEMLVQKILEVRQRLKQQVYSGRDRDVDTHMALKWETERRARAAAVAEAIAVASPEPGPKNEAYKPPPEFLPDGYTNKHIYGDPKVAEAAEKARIEKKRQALKEEEEGRPARLINLRRHLTQHGVMRWDIADLLTSHLTVNDLNVLKKNGLEAPGFFTRHYADKVIKAIDKAMPPDQATAELYEQDLEIVQGRAADIRHVAAKNEAIAAEAPHALGGRILGATTAALVGKDLEAGGDIGGGFGGFLDMRMHFLPASTNRNVRPAAQADEPVFGGTVKGGRPFSRESVPLPDSMPQATPRTAIVPPESGGGRKLGSDAVSPPPKPPKIPRANVPEISQPKRSMPKQTKAQKDAKYSDNLDKRIARVRNELSEAEQRTVEYKGGRAAAGENEKGGPAKAMWNKKEELHVLERARAYPDRTIIEQVRFVGVMGADGKITPTAAGKGRTVDFLEVHGANVLGGEVKSMAEIVHSVKDLRRPQMVGDFKTESSKVGNQRGKEQSIIDEAIARGGQLVFKGRDVRTGKKVTEVVDPKNYRSTVVPYEQVLPN